MEYESIKNILKEAGFLLKGRESGMSGDLVTGNIIALPNVPLFGSDPEGRVNNDDVLVLVNNAKVEIDSVDGEDGIIQLVNQVSDNDRVSVYYKYIVVDTDFVKVVREDVKGFIDGRVRGYDACYPYTNNVPQAIRGIMRIWAAALLLQKEYGYNTDNTDTSKDGYAKAKVAEKLLEDYIKNGGCDASSGPSLINVETGGDFMERQRLELMRDSRNFCRNDDTSLEDF